MVSVDTLLQSGCDAAEGKGFLPAASEVHSPAIWAGCWSEELGLGQFRILVSEGLEAQEGSSVSGQMTSIFAP